MSTSRYSSPYRGPLPPPNTRRWTAWKLAVIGGLFIVDLLALIGANDLRMALTFAGLTMVNLWAITRV